MMLSERENFLEAIDSDPYDLALRKVFADWLDEFGNDEDADLAVEQRAWTAEKTLADLTIKELAAKADLTYEEVVTLVKALPNFDTYDNECNDQLYIFLYEEYAADEAQSLLNRMRPLTDVNVRWDEITRPDDESYYCSC